MFPFDWKIQYLHAKYVFTDFIVLYVQHADLYLQERIFFIFIVFMVYVVN